MKGVIAVPVQNPSTGVNFPVFISSAFRIDLKLVYENLNLYFPVSRDSKPFVKPNMSKTLKQSLSSLQNKLPLRKKVTLQGYFILNNCLSMLRPKQANLCA